MIRLVTRQNIGEFFPLMIPGLERALTKTSLGEYWTLQAAWDSMVNFEVYGFHQDESQYSGIFRIASAPLRQTLYVFWGGKSEENHTPIDLVELDTFLKACAEYFQCQSILVEGRAGWSKKIQPLDYTEDTRSYVKNLT